MSATFRAKNGSLVTISLKPKDPEHEKDPKVMAYYAETEKRLAEEMEGKDLDFF